MADFKQNPVSTAVWPWTAAAQATVQPQGHGKAGAFVGFFIGWAIAGLLYYKGHHTATYIIGPIATAILICALFIPPAFHAIQKGLHIFAFWVGKVLTYVTLVPFYFLVFPLGRVFFMMGGKDAMNRKFQPDRTSYWDSRAPIEDLEQYKRQH